jgi:hypothetical protein
MMVLLGVALGAVIAMWAWQIAGPVAAMGATVLYFVGPQLPGTRGAREERRGADAADDRDELGAVARGTTRNGPEPAGGNPDAGGGTDHEVLGDSAGADVRSRPARARGITG